MRVRRGKVASAGLHNVCWCLLAWGVRPGELDALAARLNLTRRTRDSLADIARLSQLESRLEDPALAPAGVFDLLHGSSLPALTAAELLFMGPRARANVSLFVDRLRHVRPLLTGSDLRALGAPEGPQLGDILSALRSARLNGQVASRQDEEALARSLLRASQ